jgi:hypothetical protein
MSQKRAYDSPGAKNNKNMVTLRQNFFGIFGEARGLIFKVRSMDRHTHGAGPLIEQV